MGILIACLVIGLVVLYPSVRTFVFRGFLAIIEGALVTGLLIGLLIFVGDHMS